MEGSQYWTPDTKVPTQRQKKVEDGLAETNEVNNLERFRLRTAEACECGERGVTPVHLLYACPENAGRRLRFDDRFREMSGNSVPGAEGRYTPFLATGAAYLLFAEHCIELLDSPSSQDDEDG